MIAFVSSGERIDENGNVRRPMPADALGSALRGVFGEAAALPDDMTRLLRHLEREKRGY